MKGMGLISKTAIISHGDMIIVEQGDERQTLYILKIANNGLEIVAKDIQTAKETRIIIFNKAPDGLDRKS